MYKALRKILYWVRISIFVLLIVFIATSIRVYRTYDVSNKDIIMNKGDTGLMLYDRTGELFFAFDRARPRIFVPLSDLPRHTKQAIVAAEDKDFFSHYGFSPSGIVRSLLLNIRHQKVLYGGSTITQQLVKNSLLTSNKSITRKFQEIIIAVKLERIFSKKEILEMYVNSAYFGEGVFGIEAAAQTYFNKGTKELTLSESAILAGLLPAPAAFSPLVSDEATVKERQQIVLQHMQDQTYITAAQLHAALQDPVTLKKRESNLNITAPHFALMVKQELDQKYGEEAVIRAGLKITTTLDLTWQKYAELTVKNHVDSFRLSGVGNGAAVVLDPVKGEVRALVGSVDWFQEVYGKANMAVSPRQTGSAFKPIVYAAGLEAKVITATTILRDTPTTFVGNYRPQNYDGRFRGSVTVRKALANSLNIPAVETIIKTGIPNVVALAKRLGISTMSDNAKYNPSTALGAENITLLDLTSAYGALANNGTLQPTHTTLSIRDKYGREITLQKKIPVQALSSQAAFIISSILSDNRARAEIFGQLLTISRLAAVKTGTTQDYRDGWTVGYTPNLAVGVWIGNNDNTPMLRTPASVGAAPLWKNLMERYLPDIPPNNFIPPAGISIRPLCDSRTLEYFIPGTEAKGNCVPTTILTSPIPLPTPPGITRPSAKPVRIEVFREPTDLPSYRIPSSIEEFLAD